jgi:hypothetical protein
VRCIARLRSGQLVVWLGRGCVQRCRLTESVHCVLRQHAISVACHTPMQAGVFCN